MSDGYTVYILKHLECEQLPLLLSHQVSYSLYKLQFITKEMSASPSSSPPVLALPGRLPVAPTRLAVHRRLHQQRLLAAHSAQAEWSVQEGTRKVASA